MILLAIHWTCGWWGHVPSKRGRLHRQRVPFWCYQESLRFWLKWFDMGNLGMCACKVEGVAVKKGYAKFGRKFHWKDLRICACPGIKFHHFQLEHHFPADHLQMSWPPQNNLHQKGCRIREALHNRSTPSVRIVLFAQTYNVSCWDFNHHL